MKFAILIVLLMFSGVVYAQEEADREALIAEIMEVTEPEVIQTWPSSDGQWEATVTAYACTAVGEDDALMAYEMLEVTDLESGERTVAAEQLIHCQGLGAVGLEIVRWPGNYLYYTDAREGQPDGAGYWLPFIYRVDLTDMSVTSLGGGVFSMHGGLFAAWAWETNTLTVWDTQNGEAVATFEAYDPDMQLANLAWLPDDSGLLYFQADAPYMPTKSNVVHVDLAKGEQALLLARVSIE